MRDKVLLTADPVTNSNIIDEVLERIFPNSPKTKTIIKFLIRLFGYGILTYFGIEVA